MHNNRPEIKHEISSQVEKQIDVEDKLLPKDAVRYTVKMKEQVISKVLCRTFCMQTVASVC